MCGFCRALAAGFALADRFTLEMDLVGAVHEAIEDRVGERGIADVVVPVLDWKLTGHDGGSGPDPIIEHLEQIGALARADRGDGKVVD